MKKQNNYLIQQDLIDHAQNSVFYGKIENPDFESEQHNPSCGDSLRIYGSVNQGKIVKISFEGSGCMLSLAMASKLAEYLQNKSLLHVLELQETIVDELLKIALGPNRLQCGLLSLKAVQEAIVLYQKKL